MHSERSQMQVDESIVISALAALRARLQRMPADQDTLKSPSALLAPHSIAQGDVTDDENSSTGEADAPRVCCAPSPSSAARTATGARPNTPDAVALGRALDAAPPDIAAAPSADSPSVVSLPWVVSQAFKFFSQEEEQIGAPASVAVARQAPQSHGGAARVERFAQFLKDAVSGSTVQDAAAAARSAPFRVCGKMQQRRPAMFRRGRLHEAVPAARCPRRCEEGKEMCSFHLLARGSDRRKEAARDRKRDARTMQFLRKADLAGAEAPSSDSEDEEGRDAKRRRVSPSDSAASANFQGEQEHSDSHCAAT
jgi:hypothetical protein